MSRERISELFAQAIDLPAHQRADWIAAQCRGDEAMRAKVEQLLRADAKARDFMEQAPASIADAAAAAARSAAPIAFGVYRVVRSSARAAWAKSGSPSATMANSTTASR